VKSRLSDLVFLGIVLLLVLETTRMFYREQRETP